MYLEFLHPIKDYWSVTSKKEKRFEAVFPLIITLLAFYFLFSKVNLCNFVANVFNIISIVSILLGFSTAAMAILTAIDNSTLKILKNRLSDEFRNIDGNRITCFRLLLINNMYSIFIEILTLFICLLSIFLNKLISDVWIPRISLTVISFFVMHILLLILRNSTNIYLTLIAKEEVVDEDQQTED